MKRAPLFATMLSSALTIAFANIANARPLGHEAQVVIDTILAPPAIKPEDGFSAKMLIPPGELYDPLFMIPRAGAVWMNDDGRATDGHGSRVLAQAWGIACLKVGEFAGYRRSKIYAWPRCGTYDKIAPEAPTTGSTESG